MYLVSVCERVFSVGPGLDSLSPANIIDTLWLFQGLSLMRPNDMLAFDILFCSYALM